MGLVFEPPYMLQYYDCLYILRSEV